MPLSCGMARLLTMLELLDRLSAGNYRKLNPATPATEALPEPDERLNRVLALIHKRLDRNLPIPLTEAAATACLTPPAFSKYFRQATRKRFIDYVIGLKLNRAALQLSRTDGAILDIALNSGFSNLSNFNRHFLAAMGMTPRDYRARYRLR